MTLRLRLLLAMTALVVLITVGAVMVIQSQRSFLVAQVDDQLAAAMPIANRPVAGPPGGPLPAPPASPGTAGDADTPISRLFVGVVADGAVSPLLRGQLLDDAPAVPLDSDELDRLTAAPRTVDGVEDTTRFRIAGERVGNSNDYVVVALPLDEVDSAMTRLQLVVWVVTALAVALIAVTFWWVERLGLRPIRRLTETADAIAAGDRTQRAGDADPRTEAGKLAHAVNVMLDERDADEERRRRFVADASHELRTPLTSIRGYLDLYSDGRFTEAAQVDDMVRRMSRETSRMQDLAGDLLLLANLDEHRALRHDEVDLARLMDDVAHDARAVQPGREISVDVPGSPVVVTGDLFRLQQAVGALVDNALTHTTVDVHIRLVVRPVPNGVEMVVADNGPGLTQADAERVFDRFYRGDESRSRRAGGSGLGLAIAQSIVEAHGGTIELDTGPGRGCRFTIRLLDTGS